MRCSRDVVVVGAGPAGSAMAALLADQGHDVLVLEREHFPREHIGESLLPLGAGVLERLGIETPQQIFKFKRGAQFICEATGRRLDVSFDEAFPGPPRHAWQVERPLFDRLLRDRALAAGAEVRHGAHVVDVELGERAVRVRARVGLGPDASDEMAIDARYLVDATGQGRLMARKTRSVRPFEEFGVAAAYRHYDGVDEARLGEHGDIRIMMRPEGWGWVIPLPGRRLSVGIVTRERGATASLVDAYVQSSPLIRSWTEGATASTPSLVGNYSFKNEASYGQRYVCIGDAACFLDPVFSSGVSLALTSAERAALVLSPALEEGKEGDPELMGPHAAAMQQAYGAFAALIRRFYHTNMVSNLFFGAPEGAELRQGIVSVLAGDVWRADNPFQKMLSRSRRLASVG